MILFYLASSDATFHCVFPALFIMLLTLICLYFHRHVSAESSMKIGTNLMMLMSELSDMLSKQLIFMDVFDKYHFFLKPQNVSGYVCNHGSPSGERDTASPRGRYGERPQRDSVWRYICENTTCWPATAHDVTTGVPQYKCRRENTSSASSSEACVRSMARSLGDAVSRSPLGEPWLHT